MNLTSLTNYLYDLADMIRDPSPAVCLWTAGLAILLLAVILL
jgi:hypothetical protein